MRVQSFSSFALVAALAAVQRELRRLRPESGAIAVAGGDPVPAWGAGHRSERSSASPLVSDVESLITTPEPCIHDSSLPDDLQRPRSGHDVDRTQGPGTARFADLTWRLEQRDVHKLSRANTAASDGRKRRAWTCRIRLIRLRPSPCRAIGNVTASFELVRNTAKREAPLRALRMRRGGALEHDCRW